MIARFLADIIHKFLVKHGFVEDQNSKAKWKGRCAFGKPKTTCLPNGDQYWREIVASSDVRRADKSGRKTIEEVDIIMDEVCSLSCGLREYAQRVMIEYS